MVKTQPLLKSGSILPYLAALIILVLIGVMFILAILYLRPQADVLVVLSAVSASVVGLFGIAANFMKTLETHNTVNDSSTEAFAKVESEAHEKGMREGTEKEQKRVAQQLLIASATGATPVLSKETDKSEPVPVKVVAAVPVPVTETPTKKPNA